MGSAESEYSDSKHRVVLTIVPVLRAVIVKGVGNAIYEVFFVCQKGKVYC